MFHNFQQAKLSTTLAFHRVQELGQNIALEISLELNCSKCIKTKFFYLREPLTRAYELPSISFHVESRWNNLIENFCTPIAISMKRQRSRASRRRTNRYFLCCPKERGKNTRGGRRSSMRARLRVYISTRDAGVEGRRGDATEGEKACSTRVSLIAFISKRGVQPLWHHRRSQQHHRRTPAHQALIYFAPQ